MQPKMLKCWSKAAKECVQPAIWSLLQKFKAELSDLVSPFKAARMMYPLAVNWLAPTAATVKA